MNPSPPCRAQLSVPGLHRAIRYYGDHLDEAHDVIENNRQPGALKANTTPCSQHVRLCRPTGAAA